MRINAYSTFLETAYDLRVPIFDYTTPMIPVVIVLLLLTALVATEPSSGGGEG